ncbi:MAG: 30S ribosomal protein S12 methylthiotransferase RimO [Clostridia bacterium]|nr:30S ribosomal protein S12 methylthiotransferase RimO [Clostridia bacterium]
MTKEELIKKRISAISLGCDKNRVDLEHMLFALKEYGFDIVSDINQAEIIIVNTCAFIEPAIMEAMENINLAIGCKLSKTAEKIIVSGCFPMRSFDVLKANIPEVDAFITLKDNQKITEIIEKLYNVEKTAFSCENFGRVITHQGNFAYLKIADGCSNGCAYCTIPRIRGRFTSVPPKQLIKEAKFLVAQGYKELILVAQDTARYGEDLFGKPKLIEFLKDLIKIKELKWIRLQYLYPEWITDELLNFIATQEKICKYLDMPLQHIDNDILIAMNRKTKEEQTRKLVKKIREKYPEITIRSTFIIGFPGETRKQFKKLCEFIKEGNIEFASFFQYFREEKTKAYYMKNQVPNFIKKIRLKKIQKLQNIVLNKINLQKIGTQTEILIDEFVETEKIFKAHTQKNSPNIDLCVIIDTDNAKHQNLQVGQFYKVKLVEMIDCGFKGEIL